MQLREFIRHTAESLTVSLILSAIVFIPQWRFGYNWGDEGLLWYLSQRIHFGEMPIRDFWGYDPGRYLWSAIWFKVLEADGLFEQRLANACFGVIGLAAAYSAMMAAGIRRPLRISTLILLAIALGYPQHKIYEQALSLIAVALVTYALFSPSAAKRWLVLGLATGLAAIFGRNSGVYFALAAVLGLAITWRLQSLCVAWRGAASYAAGVAIGYSPMILWFAFDPRFRHGMIQTIIITPWQIPLPIPFPWRIAQSLGSISSLQATAVSWLCATVFVMYVVTTSEVVWALVKRRVADRPFILETASLCVGIAYLYQGFSRADFPHIAQSILPVFIIAVTRLYRQKAIWPRMTYIAISFVSLLAWIPYEPRIAAKLVSNQDPSRLVHFNMDGRDFILDRDQAQVLRLARYEFDRCKAGSGQLIAMPHYPGILAYLHSPSPTWETYFLHHSTQDFQLREISDIEADQTKIAIINRAATIDGRDEFKIENTNPLLVRHILDHFRLLPLQGGRLNEFEFYERNCTR